VRRALKPAAIIVVVAAILFFLAPTAVRLAVHAALASAGFPEAHGGSVKLGIHGSRIAGVRLGKKSVASASVTYSLKSLLHGRARTIEISDLRLYGVAELNGTVRFADYAPTVSATSEGPISLPVDIITVRGARLAIETPFGETHVTVSGEAVPTTNGLRMTGMTSAKRGEITGIAPIDLSLSAEGWTVSLEPIRLNFPDAGKPIGTADGSLMLAAAAGRPLTGEARLDGQDLTLAGIPTRTLSVRFTTGADGPSASLKLVPADGGTGIEGTVQSQAGSLSAKATAAIADIAPIAKAAGWAGVSGPVKASLAINTPAGSAVRPVTLDLAYDGPALDGVAIRGAKLKAAATYDGTMNALALTSCGPFSADAVALAGLTVATIAGCVGPKDGETFFSQDASGITAISASFANVTASIGPEGKSVAELKLPTAQTSLMVGADGMTAFGAAIDNAGIALPGLGAGAQGLNIQLALASEGALSGSLSGRIAAAGRSGPSLPIAGTIGGTASAPDLALTVGKVLKASITGKAARVDMPATEVGEKGIDLLRLMPGLATSASRLSGSLGFHAEADWSGNKIVSKGSVTVKDLALTTPNFTVEGVNASVALPSLVPLTIAEKQTLSTRTLNVGVPLTDGEIVFSMNRNRILNIDRAEWSVAGGKVGTYDQQLDLYGPDQHFGIVVKGVDLAQVLKLFNVNGLSAEGTLVGAIPLRHTKDTILVEHGVLQTNGEGVIRYDPADTPSFLAGEPGQSTAILKDALKDFRYRELGITLDGVLGGDEQIKMSLKGVSPKLYGGVPVSLNVNLTGALDSIARSSVEAYTRPAATIRKSLGDKSLGSKSLGSKSLDSQSLDKKTGEKK
jgi:hypothetical protein